MASEPEEASNASSRGLAKHWSHKTSRLGGLGVTALGPHETWRLGIVELVPLVPLVPLETCRLGMLQLSTPGDVWRLGMLISGRDSKEAWQLGFVEFGSQETWRRGMPELDAPETWRLGIRELGSWRPNTPGLDSRECKELKHSVVDADSTSESMSAALQAGADSDRRGSSSSRE